MFLIVEGILYLTMHMVIMPEIVVQLYLQIIIFTHPTQIILKLNIQQQEVIQWQHFQSPELYLWYFIIKIIPSRNS